MTTIFRRRIDTSLNDPKLQAALDGNAERRRNARKQAYASLPEDLQTLRRRARDVRLAVIADLDRYLEGFASAASSNGMQIHYASTASDAVQIVLDIARQHQARLVVKSKTMVGEEIRLNPALESEGLKVVETDLGEYIVQLRGEPPAHIITPAVHLSRAEVGTTFQEKLGVPFTEDIPSLTAIAREVLRQAFLDADIGISGVNFGVAENGTICLLTNEGNGRMVTTLPPVHIALMGIERLVPTESDLALMLQLLPRSATGQKLTVYTSLIRSPRRPGEPDGALERHVILVDNGRSALRQSSIREILLCIRCGACLNACPVFREIGGHAYLGASGEFTPYPGPIGSVLSPGLFGVGEFGNLAHASSLCGACKEACPVDIDLPRLLLRVRAGDLQLPAQVPSSLKPSNKNQHLPAGMQMALKLFALTAVSPRLFTISQRLAGVLGRLFSPFSPAIRLPGFTGWGLSRDFPRPALVPFHRLFSSIAEVPSNPDIHIKNMESNVPGENAPSSKIVDSASLVLRFEEELTALGWKFIRCHTAEASNLILDLLRTEGVRVIQSWEAPWLPAKILETLKHAGIESSSEADPFIRIGLTGAIAGVAETGTLLIVNGSGRPLTASLLPETHLAIIKAEDIYPDLPTVLALKLVQDAGMAVLITGPSRTADIEMTLTIGVHGPRQLVVFCLE